MLDERVIRKNEDALDMIATLARVSGMTKIEVIKKIGVNAATIYKWERGGTYKRGPSLGLLLDVLGAYDYEIVFRRRRREKQ